MFGFSKESVSILMEWGIVFSFFLLVGVSILVETVWLKRKGWAGAGKSFGFSIFTNVIGYSIGITVLFVVIALFMMLALDGSISKFPLKDTGIGITLALASLLTPALLLLCKRLALFVLKMQKGKDAWLYSIVSSILSYAISLGIPILLGYFLFKIG